MNKKLPWISALAVFGVLFFMNGVALADGGHGQNEKNTAVPKQP